MNGYREYAMTITKGKYEVTLTTDRTYGYMEHTDRGELGGLWIENGVLVDYDGQFILPVKVAEILVSEGIEVPADFYED